MPNTPLQLPPLSLYVHIPWCVRKCPYCDFNSHAQKQDMPEAEYVSALIADLKQDAKYAANRKLTSMFFGGGTPSLFTPSSIKKIIIAAEQLIGFEPNIEITLEANPGTFEQAKFAGYRQAGVNRLSIGIQSFDDLHLQQLGRIHNADEAHHVAAKARAAGFDNFNLDLMHGLPGQSVIDALKDLQTAIDLNPTHLSWYQLTIEPNTAFYSHPPKLPDDPLLEEIWEQGQQLLANNGFNQYEVSAYARANKESQHNLNYWQFGDYLGIGAGAHGKVTLIEQQQIIRTNKTRAPNDYLARYKKESFEPTIEVLDKEELPLEFMMNALRLNKGAPSQYFTDRTGCDLKMIEPHLNNLCNKELLTADKERIEPTPMGHKFLNAILEEFM
jgi:putative oxygen-independent coproporphyrinogen III oxidase